MYAHDARLGAILMVCRVGQRYCRSRLHEPEEKRNNDGRQYGVNFWEKITSDPEYGNWRSGSPLARAVIGLILLMLNVHNVVTGEIDIGRGSHPRYIHFADHRGTFFLVFIGLTLGVAWAFWSARKRYLMHDAKS